MSDSFGNKKELKEAIKALEDDIIKIKNDKKTPNLKRIEAYISLEMIKTTGISPQLMCFYTNYCDRLISFKESQLAELQTLLLNGYSSKEKARKHQSLSDKKLKIKLSYLKESNHSLKSEKAALENDMLTFDLSAPFVGWGQYEIMKARLKKIKAIISENSNLVKELKEERKIRKNQKAELVA